MTSRVWLVVAGTTVLAMLTGLVVWASTGRSCDGTQPLSVTTAPEIADAVREAANQFRRTEPAVGGRCVSVRVTGTDPARVAAAISAAHHGDLDLAGVEAAGTDVPQVWIPDASTWLARLRTVDRQALHRNAPSIAMSPVVLALPEPDARAEGWPAERIGWDYVIAGMNAKPPLPVALIEPRRSAVGLAGLLATGELARSAAKIGGKDPETAVLGTFRGLSLARAGTSDELLSRMPRTPDEQGTIRAAMLSEREVRRYDAGKPAVSLAAVYPEPAAPALDYPYATTPDLAPAEVEAAALFRRWLGGKQARAVLTRAGFRTPDGAVGPDFPTGNGVSPEPVAPPRAIPPDVVTSALTSWTEVSLASRVLAAVDVSGSMAQPVPTAGGLTRLEVTRRAAVGGLALFTDDSELGLWVFSTRLDGARDYRELVPVGPLTTTRTDIAKALTSGAIRPTGGTGLYDTIAAAYATMVANYDPEKANTVVVMTDGVNEDPDGLTEQQLRQKLEQLSDPAKPVHVVLIGIGPDVDRHQLESVTSATGGGVFVATDPSKIGEIFLKALALPSQ
ncbi:MAG: substrate-binding domain-containing protein [Micromonosporaceae bacterium]